MQLKRYQERVNKEIKLFLDALAAQQVAGNRHASLDAWEDAKRKFFIKGDYHPRKNGLEVGGRLLRLNNLGYLVHFL